MMDPAPGTPSVTFATVAARLAALVDRLAELADGHDQAAADVAKLRTEAIPATVGDRAVVVDDGLEDR